MSFGFFTSSGAVSAGRRGLTGYFVWVFLGGFGFFFGFFFVVQISFPSSKTSELGSPEKKKGDYQGLDLGEKPGILIPGTTSSGIAEFPLQTAKIGGNSGIWRKKKLKTLGSPPLEPAKIFPAADPQLEFSILPLPAIPGRTKPIPKFTQIRPNSPKFTENEDLASPR